MSHVNRFLAYFLLFSLCTAIKTRHVNEILPNILEVLQPSLHKESFAFPKNLFLIEAEPDELSNIENVADQSGFRIIRKLHSFRNVFVAERLRRRKRGTNEIVQELITSSHFRWAEEVTPFVREKRRNLHGLNKGNDVLDMQIAQLHEKGFTGKNVKIAVLDDGVDYTHPDLQSAFSPELSFDFTNDKKDPMPEKGPENSHGTQCAGILFMANSSRCGSGISQNGIMAGLKMLTNGNTVNDILEGEALAHKHEEISIYSVSWGPKDDGRTMEKPSRLASMALEKGVKTGRHGLGSLYVWASGNGGLEHDFCSMDGYASNYHTITFGVVDSAGHRPWYAEGCPAIMASVTVENGISTGLSTTKVGGGCTQFFGSSAAAPIASGILALALEANNKLTQRDVQHLIVRTSSMNDLHSTADNPITINGAGLAVSPYFGFGMLNAARLVEAALKWKTVPFEHTCSRLITVEDGQFSSTLPLSISIPFEGCKNTSAEVNFIERVELLVSLSYPKRGKISILLNSPTGSSVELLRSRKNDVSSEGISNWSFVSTHNWSETAQGEWTVKIHADSGDNQEVGYLKSLQLIIHGTKEDPLDGNEFIL